MRIEMMKFETIFGVFLKEIQELHWDSVVLGETNR